MVSVGIVDTESVIMSHIHQQQQTNHQQQQQQHQNHHHQTPLSASQANINNMAGSSLVMGPDNKCTDGSSSLSLVSQVQAAAAATTNHSGTAQTTLTTTQQQQQPLGMSNSAVASVSTSNKIINFTTSCIQFVTSLVKLVIAKLPPDGDEQQQQQDRRREVGQQLAQQDPTQLLVTLKMTQLSGVLTLVYDMLVQAFNSLTDQPSQNNNLAVSANQHPAAATVRQQQQQQDSSAPERQLALALHSLRLINYVAYIDISLLQQILAADEMLPLQLRHVCSYLISHLVQSQFKLQEGAALGGCGINGGGGDHHQQQQSSCVGQLAQVNVEPSGNLLRNELLNEIILLLGHFAYLNQTNQLMLKSGRRPTIIEQLVQLPFDYFSRQKLKLVLMPTLISCAYLNDQICSLVCQELSLSMLISFIEDQLLEAQLENKQQQTSGANSVGGGSTTSSSRLCSLVADELTNTKLASNRWRFERRFAKSKWLSAKKYFHSQQAKMRLEKTQ